MWDLILVEIFWGGFAASFGSINYNNLRIFITKKHLIFNNLIKFLFLTSTTFSVSGSVCPRIC